MLVVIGGKWRRWESNPRGVPSVDKRSGNPAGRRSTRRISLMDRGSALSGAGPGPGRNAMNKPISLIRARCAPNAQTEEDA